MLLPAMVTSQPPVTGASAAADAAGAVAGGAGATTSPLDVAGDGAGTPVTCWAHPPSSALAVAAAQQPARGPSVTVSVHPLILAYPASPAHRGNPRRLPAVPIGVGVDGVPYVLGEPLLLVLVDLR